MSSSNKPVQRYVSGFTLIEVLIVVVILGILAGIVVVNVMDKPDQAKVVAVKQDVTAIVSALKMYRLDNDIYPSGEQGLMALVRKPTTGQAPRNWSARLDKMPKDPWGNEYQYLNPGVHGEIDVFSFGADGRPGGEGINADIGSWDTGR